ncbi:hypothetical protein CK203_007696 [Vitis vinifera]|uniref:Uncharacterized protein n=1 Tax=Vitis vinifera TaxID=29760 RepID=A0A438K1H3_VITVI|nr:hypothetical protein CK203_007696 [Vitis vinifera]
MERGVRGGISGRLDPSCLRSDGFGRSGGLVFLSALLLDGRPATKTCWVAARTSSSSIEYLLARLNKSSIVVGGFLASDSKNGVLGQMLRLKISEHKYCPTKASDRSLKLPTELGERRGEHVIQPFADGANGWLVWDVSPSWLFRWVRMNVPHHGGDYGVTMRGERFAPWGWPWGQGVVPRLWPLVALIFQALDILIPVLVEALSLLLGPSNADVEEALMLKPGCVTQRFLLSIFLSLGGELSAVFRCQLSPFDG